MDGHFGRKGHSNATVFLISTISIVIGYFSNDLLSQSKYSCSSRLSDAQFEDEGIVQPRVPMLKSPYFDFDPILNKDNINKRLRNSCPTYTPTQEELNLLTVDGRIEKQWSPQRFVMYANIVGYLRNKWGSYDGKMLKVLDATGSQFLAEFEKKLNITRTVYPEVDLHKTPYITGEFDVVSADQVLEHVKFPHQVIIEMKRILKPGGIAIITSVSYNPRHLVKGVFGDYWRFMLDGMLMISMPFKSVELCGTWGTGEAIATRATQGMSSGIGTMTLKEVATKNEPNNPFLSWMVLKK